MKTVLAGRDRLKVVYVRPPSHLWPIINESDNFLAPLNFPSLAAYVRRETEGIEQKIIDCMPHKIGWKTLYKVLEEEKPDVVAVGDMIIYAHEGMRVLEMAKQINPDVVTLAGGVFHSHMPEHSLKTWPQLDAIVRYEGELTTVDMLNSLREGKDWKEVQGIAYRENGGIIETAPRPLIEDLDSLPIPAYDMIPLEKYSPFGMLWPRAATIQGNRGCPYICEFCSWSANEGERILDDNGQVQFRPKLRMKSAERVVEEVELLYEKYGVRYLFWVDATWNADSKWLDKFSSEIIRREYKLGWWSFVRADLMLRQQEEGVLDKMVAAGLRHCLFGAERNDVEGLAEIGKDKVGPDHFKECCRMLEDKHPEVFRQACFLVGLPSDSPEKLTSLQNYIDDTHVDFPAIHPLMPYPGTPAYTNFKEYVEEWDFSKWDMFVPVIKPKNMTREEVSAFGTKISSEFVKRNPWRYIKGMFSRHKIRRRLYWWFLFAIFRVLARDAFLALIGKKKFEGFGAVSRLWKPKWYDS